MNPGAPRHINHDNTKGRALSPQGKATHYLTTDGVFLQRIDESMSVQTCLLQYKTRKKEEKKKGQGVTVDDHDLERKLQGRENKGTGLFLLSISKPMLSHDFTSPLIIIVQVGKKKKCKHHNVR